MTEHDPSSENDIFESLVQGLSLEQLDPIAEVLLQHVRNADRKIAACQGSDPSDTVIESLGYLNAFMEEYDLSGNGVYVSGRIRPIEGLVDGFDSVNADDYSELLNLGEMLYDERGPYWKILHKLMECGQFDAGLATETEEPGEVEPKISTILYLNAVPGDKDTENLLYVFPGELDTFTPENPSDLKVAQDLRNSYPDIALGLDQLPDDCRDDLEILIALKAFSVQVDWTKYPRHDDTDRAKLIESMERYITNRLQLDDCTFTFFVHGSFFGIDKFGKDFPVQLEKPTEMTAKMLDICLLSDRDESSNIETFVPMIKIEGDAERRRSGKYVRKLPCNSIASVKSARVAGTTTGLGIYELEITGEDYERERIPEVAARENTVTEPTAEVTKRTLSLNEQLVADVERLAVLDTAWKEMFEELCQITSQKYPSLEHARQACIVFKDTLLDFADQCKDDLQDTEIEVSGPGVYSIKPELKPEDCLHNEEYGEVNIALKGLRGAQGDTFTVKRGQLDSELVTIIDVDSGPDGFSINANLVFSDSNSLDPLAFKNEDEPIPMLLFIPISKFLVSVDSDESAISIPKYEYLKRRASAIGKVASKYGEYKDLPTQLLELHSQIERISSVDYTSLDVDLLQAIGTTTGGDEEASADTVDALGEILRGLDARIVGCMYDSEGVFNEEIALAGTIVDVVSTTEVLKTQEPMLIIKPLNEEDVWHVPLSTIKEFIC